MKEEQVSRPSLLVRAGHKLLQSPFVFDAFQTCVGAYKLRKRFVNSRLDPTTKAVLDLGCGTGVIIPEMPKTIEFFGIEISRDYVEIARKQRPNSRIFLGSVDSRDSYASIYLSPSDIVFALGLFHHLDDKAFENTLKNLSEIAPKGATLHSLDPFIDSRTSKLAAWMARNDRGRFIRGVSEYEELFKRHGFDFEFNLDRKPVNVPSEIIIVKARKL